MDEKPLRLHPLRIPAGWNIVWNELCETLPDDSETTLLMARKESWFVDVSWSPGRGYWLRVVKADGPTDEDPWAQPLYEFDTGSLTDLAAEVERVLDRGIY